MNLKHFLHTLLLLFSLNIQAVEEICQQLIKRGFPKVYAIKLAPLQKKHPNWYFEPLHVTKLNPKYTWNYVLHQETNAKPSRSLISSGKIFSAYFHPTDQKSYDAGCRRASTQAVAYFLDSRNFLNERDIFQFENLNAPNEISLMAVKSAIAKTFMANAKLENGKTYAEYFCELGKLFNIDPLFLASRTKQEQGLTGTPLISGKCGSLLLRYYKGKIQQENNYSVLTPNKVFAEKDLLKYDGLYNFFNINASGNGRFTIYLNGMKEALNGTPAMTAKWGSPVWNKKYKSLYGGAVKIARRYVNNHQNTRYLQKWNVDFRSKTDKGESRNFWGQYMQNIGAAFSEAVNDYNALKKEGLLDLPYDFLIPVYDGMPPVPSPDPAKGKCPYYKTYSPIKKVQQKNNTSNSQERKKNETTHSFARSFNSLQCFC